MFASMMGPIVASNLGMRSVVLAGRQGDPEVAKELEKVRARLLTNTTVVVLHPEMAAGDGEWLLGKNPLYRAALESLKTRGGRALMQVCESGRCLDTFDMGGLERALGDLE